MKRARWRTADRARRAFARCLVAAALLGCDGRLVTLGEAEGSFQFGLVERVPELVRSEPNENPSMTADALEIYFTSREPEEDGDVYFAVRGSRSEPFGAPQPLAAVNSAAFETSPAISADGLELWVGSDRPGQGGQDIWVSTRAARSSAWSSPSPVGALNSAVDEIPRPLGMGGRIMPLSSTRDAGSTYWTYLAERLDDGAFATPELVEPLAAAFDSATDACLTPDGLTLLFAGYRDGAAADLYVSRRPSPEASFGDPIALEQLNTPFEERDPHLSADGSVLYFASDRNGVLEIYRATVLSAP